MLQSQIHSKCKPTLQQTWFWKTKRILSKCIDLRSIGGFCKTLLWRLVCCVHMGKFLISKRLPQKSQFEREEFLQRTCVTATRTEGKQMANFHCPKHGKFQKFELIIRYIHIKSLLHWADILFVTIFFTAKHLVKKCSSVIFCTSHKTDHVIHTHST